MKRTVKKTISISSEIWSIFTVVCTVRNKSYSKVLSELMEAYISEDILEVDTFVKKINN